MAGIEKTCECPDESCEYHGWKMYDMKRNHIQVNEECRSQFHGLDAEIYLLRNIDLDSDRYDVAFGKGGWMTSLYHKDDFWWKGRLYNEGQFKRVNSPYVHRRLTPVKRKFQIEIAVYVKDHYNLYFNTIYDIRKFKKNMIKMFGYMPKIHRLKKSDCKGYDGEYYAIKNFVQKKTGFNYDDY